jgi:acetoin utilization deacetylase AcuC-like enzyme
MARRLYYCDHHEIPLPPGHKFPIRKYPLVRERLASSGLFEFQPAPFAALDTIALAHHPTYIQDFVEGKLPPPAIRRIGFPWSDGFVRRTLASVGGTLSATADAFQSGWSGNLAGGTHHAFHPEGSGFSVFNDIAVAIHWLRREGMGRRVAVVDLDVHQGDGTAALFERDDHVLTLSMHARNNFPFRKQRGKVDVALPDGTADEEYLEALRRVLPAVGEFRPDAVFYQSGVDALATDRLGRLHLTERGLRERDRVVMESVRAWACPFVITLGGGYSDPIEVTADAHASTYLTAARIFSG